MNTVIASGKLPTNVPNYWPLFWSILVLGFLANAATSQSWSMAFGYVLVPALVGGFIIRGATGWERLTFGYLVFIGLLSMLVYQDGANTIRDAAKTVHDSCMTRNAEVAKLPSEEQKETFCSCYSEGMAWPVVKETGVSFLLSQVPKPIQDNPELMSVATAAVAECAANI